MIFVSAIAYRPTSLPLVDQDPRIERYMQRVRHDHNDFLNQIKVIEVTPDLLDGSDDAVAEDCFYGRFMESLQDFYDVCGFFVADFDILYQIAEAWFDIDRPRPSSSPWATRLFFVVPSLALHWDVDSDNCGCFWVDRIHDFRQIFPSGDLSR
jgi:hypothetical protein